MLHLLFLEPFLTPILLIFVALVLLGGFFLILSIYKKEKAFEAKRENEFSEYEKVLNEAHFKAERIIEQATEDAKQLSFDGENFNKALNEQMHAACQQIIEKNLQFLDSNTHEMFTSYQSYLQSVKGKYERGLDATLATIQKQTEAEFTALQQVIKEKMIGTENGISKKMDDEFAQAQIEINEYKKHKLQEINKHIDSLILNIAEEILGQTIPLAQHQELILQALEKAQREGMFD